MSTQTLNGKSISNYPVFEGSQVLTSDQLNNLFEYLDQQNRYTRSKLTGIGVVCGLNVSTEGDSVKLSEGIGITSDGFLIKMPDCEMNFRRDYFLPSGVFYNPFGTFDNDKVYSQDNEIKLYELLSKEPEDTVSEEINSDFFSDKYLFIFLECFDRDPRSCLGKNCEDLGKERIFTIRKLAVDQKGLVKMLEKEDGTIENPFYSTSALRHIDLQKPLFAVDSDACKSYEGFVKLYAEAIKGNEETENIFELLFGIGNGAGLLHKTYDEFEPLLNVIYNDKNPLTRNSAYSSLKKEIREIIDGVKDPGTYSIQYVYEYLCLIIQAYHEFAATAERLASACCPKKEFSLHLLLGKIRFDAAKEADESAILGQSRFRHQFLQPRIFNQQQQLQKEVISLHRRLILMLESFDSARISDVNLPLKITPTISGSLLGESAVPFYLLPDKSGSVEGILNTQLDREWNFELTTTSRKENRVISYHSNKLIGGEPLPAIRKLIETPLFFNKQNHSYRVEGIFGKSIDKVRELELTQRDIFNLPYEILPIRFGEEVSDILVENQYWIDLQSDYMLIKSGLIATVRNLLGDLKSFHRIASEWDFDYEYANVYNFKIEVGTAIDEIVKSLGLCEEGERMITSLTDAIEELHNNGEPTIPFVTLSSYYKTYRRNLSKTFLRLEYATEILNWEKIEVLPNETFHDWTKQIGLVKNAISDFLSNNEFFQLFNLYHRFVNRYEYLQKNHYSVFCNFLKLHPGIEQRPVDRGGTHVLVYDPASGEEEKIANRVMADFNLPYRLDEQDLNIPLDPSLNKMKLPPLARGEAVLITQGNSRLIDATANDLDPNGDTLKINRKGFTDEAGEFNPGKSINGGEVIYHEGENAILRYESERSFSGNDHFEYTVENSSEPSLKDGVVVEILVIAPYLKHVKAIDDLAATDNHHSVLIEVLTNDTVYADTKVIIPSSSEFGASLVLNADKKVRYTPVHGREGKDSFTYELEHTRNINETEVIEKSKATVEVIVFCCDKVEFELICEGNVGQFDVLTDREKEESAELVLLDDAGKPTDKLRTENGVISVIRDIDEPEERDIPTRFESAAYLEYVPNDYFIGKEEFTYEVIDKEGFIRRVRLHVLVIACSETKLVRTLKGTPCDFEVVEGRIRSLKVFSERSELLDDISTDHGKAEVIENDGLNLIRYTPDPDYYGLDLVQFAVQGIDDVWHYNTLNIIVDGYEKVRVESTFQDTPATFEVLSGRMLEEGCELVVFDKKPEFKEEITTAEGGKAIAKEGNIRYEPKTSFLGDDSFKYAILKDDKPFEYGVFYVILDTNRKVSVEYTRRDTVKDIYVLTEEQVSKEAILTIVTEPAVRGASAKVERDGDGVSFIRYSPAEGYVGQDNYGYVIELDEVKLFGTIYMIVDSNERIEVQTVFKNSDTAVVLFDEEQTITKFEIIKAAGNGDANWDADKKALNYTPNPDFVGHDKVKYKASFGDSIQYGTIFFIVTCDCKDIGITGTVTDETGEVLENVRVEEIGTGVQVLTGKSGVFSLVASPTAKLRFSKVTHVTKEVDVAYRTTLNVQLERKRVTITGVVQNEALEPIRNALVETDLGNTTTDESGMFTITTYASSRIRFSARGFKDQNVLSPITDQDVVITLIADVVKVFATARDERFGQTLFGNEVREVGTDNTVLTEVATPIDVPADAKIEFSSPGFISRTINVDDLVIDNGETNLEVNLKPAIINVSGKVKNDKGEIITGASIQYGPDATNTVLTDVNGIYQAEVPLWNLMMASASGHKNSRETNLISRTTETFIKVRETRITIDNSATLDFTLLPDVPTLTGTVHDEFNDPIVGANVTSSRHSTLSDKSGHYEVIVNPGEPVTFTALDYMDFNVNGAPPAGMVLNIRMNSIDRQRFVWKLENVFNETEMRIGASAFNLGSSIYIVMGGDISAGSQPKPPVKDVLVYDTDKKEFSNRKNFPGEARMNAVSFVIGDHAYLGLGNNGDKYFSDFWMYRATEDNWVRIKDFPGQARTGVVGFSIENIGYIGTGSNEGSTKNLKEFWAYDPEKDEWTQKANFAGRARKDAACFTLNDIGYVGTGWGVTSGFIDFWAYDPKKDSWERKSDINGVMRQGAFGFALDGNGFIGAGKNGDGMLKSVAIYNPDKDEWNQSFNLPNDFASGFGLVVGQFAYAGFGENEEFSSVIFQAQWRHWN